MTKFSVLMRPVICAALMCAACGTSNDQLGGGIQQQPPPPPPGGVTTPAAGGAGGSAAPADTTAGTAAPPVTGGAAGAAQAGAGAAGEDAMAGGAGGAGEPAGPQLRTIPSARGMCNLNTGWPGDDACLAPPAPDKGFQIHVGPDDYNNAAQVDQFVFEPGQETSECYMKNLPIDKEVLYLQYEFSGRPGTHHIINTILTNDTADGFGPCEASFAPGSSNNGGSLGGASKPHMLPIPVAPENETLGIPLQPNTQVQHDMHYFNLTDEPILREFWMNIYYVDPAVATERPNRIAGLGGFGWSYAPIQPGVHMTYPYECPIMTDGRIIQLLGHTHKHGIRETAHIRRSNGERVKVFEQYDYLEPQIFMYDSLSQNPEFSDSAPGAYTGLLEVKAGDVLEWECEVNNTSEVALTYSNFVETGEMCNIWGMTVGPLISCFLR